MGSNRPAARNQRAKLAADLNDLFKDLQSNQVKVVGNYHLGQLIGQGTYGKVKLATHALTGQQVAVKIVAKAHAAIITREIYHWRCLTHANIAHLHEVLTTESKIYLVTEYCPNGELLEALIRDGKCKPSLAKKWFRQICLALQYCHAKKIVHRDLKLENILLDSQDNIKLIDFGFTRECESKKLLESYCGSAAYTAPEIIVGKKYSGPEADIWSLGVILYTLLAGYLPFDDDNESVVQDKIVDLDYEMPNELFCKDAQDLIKSILKEEPTERFTIDQILSHPWWTSGEHESEDGAVATDGTQNEDNTTHHARQGSLTKREIHPVHSSQNGPEVVYGSSPQFVSPLAQYPFNPWGNQSPYALNPTTSDALRAAFPGGPSNPSPIASPLPSPSPMVNKSFPRHESGADTIQGSRSPSAGGFPATGFEQRLMTLLGRIGFDQEIFTKGVPNQSCDPGYGLWCLLVDQIRQRAIDNGTSLEWEQSIAYIDAASLLGHGALNGASSSALINTTLENGKRSPRPMSDPSPTSSQTNLLLPQASLHQQQAQQQAQLQAHQDLQQQTIDLKQQLDQYKLEVELFKVEKQLLEKQKQCLEESQAASQTHQSIENKELPPIYAQDVPASEPHSSSKNDRPVQDSGVSVSTNSTPHSSWELTEREGPVISIERPRRKSKGILHSLKDRFFHSASDSEYQHHHSGSSSPYPPSPAPAKHFAGSTASASSSTSSATTYATTMTPKPLPAPPAHPYPHPHPHLLQQPATHSPLSIVSYKSASTSSLAMDTSHAAVLPAVSQSAASTDHLVFDDRSLESETTSSTAPKRGGFMTWITESASGTVLNKSPVIHSSAKVPKRLNTKSFSGAETFPLPSTSTKSSASSLEEARPQIPAIPASFFQPMWKASSTQGSSASLTAPNAGPSTSTLATSAPTMSIRQRLASFSSSSAKITPEERQRAAAAAAAAVALVAAPAPPERAHSPSPPSSPRGSGGSSAFGVLGSAKSKKDRHHQQDEISDIVAAAVAATASAHLQSSGSRKKTTGTSSSSSKKTRSEKASKFSGGSSKASEAEAQGSSRHVRQPSESSWKPSAPSLQIPSPPLSGAPMDDLAPSTFSLTAKDATRKPSIKASKATMPSLMTAFSSFKPSRSAPSSPVVQQPIQQLKQAESSVEAKTRRRDSRSSRHDEPSNLARVMSNSSSRSSAATTPISAAPTASLRMSQEKRMSSSGMNPATFDKETDQPLRMFDDGVVIQDEVRPKKRTTSRTSITAASLSRKSNESVLSSLDRSEPSSPHGTIPSPMGPSKRTSHGSLGSRRSSSSSMRDRNIFGLTLESTGSGSKKSSLNLSRTSLSKSTFQSPAGSPVHTRRGIDMDRERGGHGHISRSSNDEGRPSPRSVIISAAEMAGSNVDRVYESLRRESGQHRRSESIPENRVGEVEDMPRSHPSTLTLQQRGGLHGSSSSSTSDHVFSRHEAASTADPDNNSILVASATAATITPSLSASSSLNQVEATEKDEGDCVMKSHGTLKEEKVEEEVQAEDEDPLFNSGAPRLDFADGCSLIPSPPPSPAPHLPESSRGSGSIAARDISPRMERDLSMLEEPKMNLLSTSYPPPRTSLSYTPASASISEDMDALAAHPQEATSPPSPSRPLVSFDQHFSNQAKIKEYRDSTPRKVVNGFQPLAAKRLSKPGLANNNASNTTSAGDAPAVPGLPPSTGHSLTVANGPPNAFAGRRRGYRNSTGSMANMTLQQQQTFQQLQKEQLMKIQQNQPNAGYEATAAMKIHPRPRTGLFPKREYGGGALGGLGGLGGAGVPSGLGNSCNNGSQGGFEHSYDANMGSGGGGVGGKRDSYSSRRQSMAVAMGKRPGAGPAVIQEEEE
ncbi:hypothetical protein EC968_008882 [Mortierella alpina]|nr:hypothetical protein EC968_008882 [Mortierella alpina]